MLSRPGDVIDYSKMFQMFFGEIIFMFSVMTEVIYIIILYGLRFY